MRTQPAIRGVVSCLLASCLTTSSPSKLRADSDDAGVAVIRGNIEKFTTTQDGQINGAILDNESETVLQWPARLQEKFDPPLQAGDRIRAIGRRAHDDVESPRFLVKSITNLKSRQTVENPAFQKSAYGAPVATPKAGDTDTVGATARSSPAPIPVRVGRTIVVRGYIERFTVGPAGETIGAVLDSDSEMVLRWPAALQERFLTIMKIGDRVRATGERVNGPTGDNMILVKSVTNLESREMAEDPAFDKGPAQPTAPPGAAPSHELDLEQRLRRLEGLVQDLQREITRLRERK